MTVSQQNSSIDLIPTSALVLHYADIKCFNHNTPNMQTYYGRLQAVIEEQCKSFTDPDSPWMKLPPDAMVGFKNRIKERKFHFMTAIEHEINEFPHDPAQVVLVANGYNPMAVALAERNPQVNFYVTDRSEQACNWNKAIYQELGLHNLIVVQSDCTKDDLVLKLQEVTGQHYGSDRLFRTDMRTIFAIEGLIFYIDQEHEEKLVNTSLAMQSPRNVVLLDYQDQEVLGRAETYEYEGNSEPMYHKLFLRTISEITGCASLRPTTYSKIFNYIHAHFTENHPRMIDMYNISLSAHDYGVLYQLDPAFDPTRCSPVVKGCRIAKIISVPKN